MANLRRKLAVSAILTGIILLVVLLYALARPSPVSVQVTFVGFTNLPVTYTTKNGTFPVTLANFCVSNSGSCEIFELGWYSYDIRGENLMSGLRTGAGELRSVLKAGESKTISLNAPWDNTQPWRVGLSFSKMGWRYRLAQKPPWIQDMVSGMVPQRWLMNNHERDFYSEWVNGPELNPGH